jgi:O-antigen/teichoic acid export membrane protein
MIKKVSKKLLSNKALLKYVSVSYLSIPISLITGFLTFRKIDPVLMGFWSLFTVFETYSTIMRLGIVNGMNRELPNAMGVGNGEKASRYASTTLFYTIIEVLILLIAAPIIIWQLGFKIDPNLKMYFYATALVSLIRVVVSFYITYLSGTLRSDDSFNKLSNINATILFMKLAFCPLVFFGFYGFLIYELVALLTNVFLLHKFRPLRVLPKFYKGEMMELFKIGFPIFLVSSAISYIDTIPRLYIIQYSTAEMLGLYTPVIMLISIISILPNSLSAYMYPKFTFQMAQSNDLNGIWKKLIRIYAASFGFIVLASLAGYYLLDHFVYLFPKYALSKDYLKLSLLLCPFVFFRMGNTLHIVLKKFNYMVLFTVIYGLTQLISLKVVSHYFTDIIEIVIWSQIYTSILVFLVGLGLNYRLLHLHRNSVVL